MPNRAFAAWLLVLVVALSASGMLIVHTMHHAKLLMHSSSQARHNLGAEPLRWWMTIPYIAAIYHVPAKVLYDAVGIPPEHHRPWTIGRIARQQSRPVGELIANLENAIARAQGHELPRPAESPL